MDILDSTAIELPAPYVDRVVVRDSASAVTDVLFALAMLALAVLVGSAIVVQ